MKDAEVILKCVNGHDRCYLGTDERCQYCERRILPLRDKRGRFARPALLALLLLAGPASAQQPHMTPQHWYPVSCCSLIDCRPAPCEQLEELSGGRIKDIKNGQIYSKDQVRSSQDNRCHICTSGGLPNSSPICAFVVNGS